MKSINADADNTPPFPPRIAQAYQQLGANPQFEAMLDRHFSNVQKLARKHRSCDAEPVILDAAVKAIVSFDPVRAEWAWIIKSINLSICSWSRLRQVSKVREAYLKYVEAFPCGPTIKQLAKAAKLTVREVFAVWFEIAAELQIEPSNDSVILSLPPSMRNFANSSIGQISLHKFFLHEEQLDEIERALLLLTYFVGFAARDLLELAGQLREHHSKGASAGKLESVINCFAKGFGELLGIKWTEDWLDLTSDGQIRVRIHRARKKFQKLSRSVPSA